MANSVRNLVQASDAPTLRGQVQSLALVLTTTGSDFLVYTPATDKCVFVKGMVGAETNAANIAWKQRSTSLTGTVATTSASAVITGTGTNFLTAFTAANGYISGVTEIVIDDTTTFVISSVDSNTQITATSTAGSSVSGKNIKRQDPLVTPEYAANQGVYSKVMKDAWDFSTATGYSLIVNTSAAISSLLVHVQEGHS